MKPLIIGRKYNCEEEWWDGEKVGLSQKQRQQWRSYVTAKLAEKSCPAVDDNTPRDELDEATRMPMQAPFILERKIN